ncbi:MAG: type IV pilus secretin PilQ [Desulfobacteraceae bacterium]|nr:MAG: type IV pilus secretin PilQ [Desulfobacteraceae bacterium]
MNFQAEKFIFVIPAAAVLFLAALSGCAEKAGVKSNLAFEKWRLMAEENKGHSPSVQEPSASLSHIAAKREASVSGQKALPSKRITMKLQDTAIPTILRALARSVELNILINENIKGKTSVHVKDAGWDELFIGIIRSNGLAYVWEGDLLRVMTIEDMERDLKQAEQKRDLRLTEPMLTRIIPIRYADEKKLSENLMKFLSRDQKGNAIGSVLVDAHTKSLVIQALQSDLDKLASLAQQLDKPISQVLIEANIIETSRETARDLGIQWGGLVKRAGTTNQYLTSGANSSGALGNNLDSAISPTSGMAGNFPADLGNSGGLTIGYVAEKVGNRVLAVQLSALQSEGKLNILSSPSITTLDNQSAIIESGATVPYQTVSSNGDINIEWKDAVLRLEVEPHVIDDTSLRLAIKTRKDELDFSREVDGNPTIITKKAETAIFLFDGQTTVIGGLNKETKTDTESGIPLLMHIPYIGSFFKGTSQGDMMEDVLIFITPHILKKYPASQPEETKMPLPEDSVSGPKAGAEIIREAADEPLVPKEISVKQPVVLGKVAAEKHETLWEMVLSVYGEYRPEIMKEVMKINPHIKDPDWIGEGQIIYFPAVKMSKPLPERNAFWIQVEADDDLSQAYRKLQSYRKVLPDIRMVPYWSDQAGLKFAIILKEVFFAEEPAREKQGRLPESIRSGTQLISMGNHGMVFYADPFLSYE